MGMQEAKVEKYLHAEVSKLGGTTRKFVSPGRVGVPDRIVILKGGKIWFVEVKTFGNIPSLSQNREICRLKTFGCNATFVAGKEGVDRFIEKITTTNEKF